MSTEARYIDRLNLVGLEKSYDGNKYVSKCPICKEGKSWNRPRIKRFCIFKGYNGNLVVKCLNCGYTSSFEAFLKEYYHDIYKEFIFDKIKNDNKPDIDLFEKEKPIKIEQDFSSVLSLAQNILEIHNTMPKHPVIEYLRRRLIPQDFYKDLYFINDFSNFCNNIKSFYKDAIDFDTNNLNMPAILIPIYDKNNKLCYIQARNLLKSNIRYLTIKLDKTAKKIWGLANIDINKPIFVFEGVFDAIFMKNSIAMLGSNISDLDIKSDNIIFVMDNELNKKEINNIALNTIRAGYKIMFWTTDNKYKDLNEMVIANYISVDNIESYILENTKSGFQAEIELKMRKNGNI